MSKQTLKNNICFLLDSSGSMSNLRQSVIDVFNQQIQNLIDKSKVTEQETRVSVFTFDDEVKNACWDTDVLRAPSIEEFYKIGGMTAMIDCARKALSDLQRIPELYHDAAFLIIVISDGMNNISNHLASKLKQELKNLPVNYTVAFLGPNQAALDQAQSFGFDKGNCQIWSTTSKGVVEVGEVIKKVTDNFMVARSTGVRSTKNLFDLKTAQITKSNVVNNLEALDPKEYTFLHVRKDAVLKEFVESWKLPFRQGGNYYQLSKTEKIQGNKHVCIRDKKNGKVYTGDNARSMLGLPSHEVKVQAIDHPLYDLFIQSNSNNRKLIAGTELLVML